MAGADGVQNHELDSLEVPDKLHKRGNKFVKWPKSDGDDSIVATPVTLKIDPKGYIIYWQEPNKDTESLEVSSIRDTRIGKFARIPKSEKWDKVLQCLDPQIRDVAGNTSIPLESKCLTIVYGMKFHEPQFLNFIAVEENPLEIIKHWADFLLELACHPLTRHISVERSIEKLHTKMIYETNTFGKIPVRKCIKMLGGNQARAGNAFNSVGLTTKGKKDEMIEPGEFPLIAFRKVLQLICQRPELDKVFTRLGGKMYLSLEQTKRFINTTQRDSRLNEILHPFLTDEQVKTLIAKYEPNVMLANRSQLSLEGLDAFLQSDENMPVSSRKYSLYQDMSQPLAHYFINSSHNTYLTGTQYRSRSTAEMYRQCLLSGCRCVELDCWDSGGQVEPYITHGFTLCSEVSFKEVIEAIDESAFKTSPYPVILSFENHVDSPSNQAKMAQYCRDIFGDKLLIDPLEQFPLDTEVPLPSPKDLIGKIIVKNKKQKPGDKKSPGEEKGRHANKRASIQADSNSFSPSAVAGTSPQNSPFPYTKSGSRTSSSSSTKSAGGRKQSAPNPSLSPTLSDGNLKGDVTNNGAITRCGSVGSDVTSKSRRPRSKPRGQSFDDEPIPEMSPVSMISSSATLPRNVGTPQKNRKQSAPPTTDLSSFVARDDTESNDGSEDLSKQSSVDNSDAPEGDETTKNENGAIKEEDEEDDDDDDDENEGQLLQDEFDINRKDSGTATKESRAYEAMSSLVNYIQPVRFKSFEHSEKKKRSYEISSLTENGALRLLTYYPIEIVNYNKRQLSRIYPKGARMDSSNYNPQLFWNAGCQLVALNFQTLCASMQLNLSLFEFNDNCGYLLKPEHMRRKDRQFDPFAHNTIDGVVAAALSIKVISGQFLSTSRVNTCVEVDMMGLVADTVKRRFKTCTIQGNGTNPHYNSEPFLFPKVVLPSLATICFSVKETNGNYIGQRYLPVESLRPGYRYITLRNDGNQPLTMPSIFVYIEVKDYIPEKLEMMAAMLANPIEHLKKKEKEEEEILTRRKALHRLLDDEEKRNIPGLQPTNGKGEDKPALIVRDVMPNAEMPPSEQSRIFVIPEEEELEKRKKSTGTLDRAPGPSLDQHLTQFTPAGIDTLQKCKEYLDLSKKINKRTADFIKKQRDEYDVVFSAYFEKQKRSSFFFPRAKDKLRKISLPFDLNTALPPEAKKEHMLILIKRHLDNELQAQQDINYDFVEEFKEVIKREQIKELKQLEKLAEKEEIDVKAKKKAEREENIKKLPKNVTKEQLDSMKDDIDKKYIEQTVKEVRFLHELQEKRCDEIRKQQQEIAAQVSDLERMRVKEFARMHREQTEKVAQIFDIRQAEYYRKRGHSTINSVSYSNDGTNDGDYTTKL